MLSKDGASDVVDRINGEVYGLEMAECRKFSIKGDAELCRNEALKYKS